MSDVKNTIDTSDTPSAAEKTAVRKTAESRKTPKTVSKSTAEMPEVDGPQAAPIKTRKSGVKSAVAKTEKIADTAGSDPKAPDIADDTPKTAAAVEETDNTEETQAAVTTETSAAVEESVNTESTHSGPDGTSEVQTGSADTGTAKKHKRSVVGIVFTCIGGAIVLLLLFVAIVLAVDKFVKKSPVPSFFGTSLLIVTTGSMSGTIEDGDMIVVKRADSYKVGDIITFMPAGDTVPTTHRIIRISNGRYYTKGDANNAEDTRSIAKSDIVGKVTNTLPTLGLLCRWFTEEFGWLYLVAIIIVVVVGIVLLKQFPRDKKE